MPKLVADGASIRCSEGLAPSKLTVLPTAAGQASELPAATVDDHQPMLNVAPFGMCKAQANPQVASATAAAQGVLTPQPCVPVLGAPWSPGSPLVRIGEVKALTADSTCKCAWSGTIDIVDPGSVVEVEG